MAQIQNKQKRNHVTHTFQTSPNKELREQGVVAMTKSSTHSDGSIREGDPGSSQLVSHIPLWVSIVVILGALLIATGAVISKLAPTLLTNGEAMTGAARVYADYMFARNLPLAMMLFLLLATKARKMLAGLMVLTALIQIIAVINDLTRGRFLLVA